MNLRNVTIGLSSIVLLGIILFSGRIANPEKVLFAIFYCLVFAGYSPIVSIVLSLYTRNLFSQIILLMASLLYGVWLTYAVYDAFFVNIDPQSALVFLGVGIYSFPVMLPLWITAYVLNRYYTKKQEPQV